MSRIQRLLIVEDDTRLRRSLARYFEMRGLAVSQAGSIHEATQLLDELDFDAVVLDVGLPDGDGLSLLPRTQANRSVVVSATPDPVRFEDCGVRHHMPKPVDLHELMYALDTLGPA